MHLPKWIEWLDRKIGSWGVPHSVRIVIALSVASFVLDFISPGFAQILTLDPVKVLLQAEWWRVITFLFAVPFTSSFFGVLFFVFGLIFLWNIGEGLESEWGAFKLNLYIIIPALALIFVALGPWPQQVSNTYIAASLLLAFATVYPDYEISLFPIPIPFRIFWLGVVVGALALLSFIGQPSQRLEILASFSSYLTFFSLYWYRELKQRQEIKARRKKFETNDEDKK